MHSRRCEQGTGAAERQFLCLAAAVFAGAGYDALHHAGFARALQNRLAVFVEGVVGQVATDVNEFHVWAMLKPRIVSETGVRLPPAIAPVGLCDHSWP
jgi:hypothetical protein